MNILSLHSYHVHSFYNRLFLSCIFNNNIRLTHAQKRVEITSHHLELSFEATVDNATTDNGSIVVRFIIYVKLKLNQINYFFVFNFF
jgi:hypothetical protein